MSLESTQHSPLADRGAASKPRGNVHWVVPRPVSSLFTGRTELLSQIQNAFQVDRAGQSEEQKRLVIVGRGGIGKSEVCLKAANMLREEYVTLTNFVPPY